MNLSTDGKGNEGSVVLVAIDFSSSSPEVLRTAASIAHSGKGELHLVHVVRHPTSETTVAISADRDLDSASNTDSVHTRLQRLGEQVGGVARRVLLHVRVGKPDVEIAQLAHELGADLLVIGTHGRTGMERLILGSVAESLVRHAPCTILTCRPKMAPMWDQIVLACPDCVTIQRETQRARLWCDRHAVHHPRGHTYSELPPSYGIGAQTFRFVD
jgi:nucleotide-binding universal stress UspA family protein